MKKLIHKKWFLKYSTQVITYEQTGHQSYIKQVYSSCQWNHI